MPRPFLAVLVLDCCLLAPAWAGGPPSSKDEAAIRVMVEKEQTKELRALGDRAVPVLVELFKQGKHRPTILPLLANSKTKLARTAIEEALRTEEDNDWIFWEARALGLLNDTASKPVLLATIQRVNERLKALGERETPPDEPNGLGVMLGGTTDCAHFALIWALGRLEGKSFVKSWVEKDKRGDYTLSGPLSLDEVSACILWWREYKKTLQPPGKDPELTPEACKKALLEMMRSEAGRALEFFDKDLVDKMEKVEVKKGKEEYHWTGAYRFDPAKKKTYVLFVSIIDGRPPLLPHPKGYLIHLNVYEGSFEVQGGRVVATVPKYKYTLLD
jgi:hypothetical protein